MSQDASARYSPCFLFLALHNRLLLLLNGKAWLSTTGRHQVKSPRNFSPRSLEPRSLRLIPSKNLHDRLLGLFYTIVRIQMLDSGAFPWGKALHLRVDSFITGPFQGEVHVEHLLPNNY